MLKKLLIGIVCIAAMVITSSAALYAADRSSSAQEPSITCSEITSSPISHEAAAKKWMFKPLEVPESYIASYDSQIDGEIIGSRDDIHALSQNDVVYVNVGSDDAVTQGTRCVIYRKGEDVSDAGISLKALGELEIVGGIQEKSSTARIVYSHEPVMVGDIVEIE